MRAEGCGGSRQDSLASPLLPSPLQPSRRGASGKRGACQSPATRATARWGRRQLRRASEETRREESSPAPACRERTMAAGVEAVPCDALAAGLAPPPPPPPPAILLPGSYVNQLLREELSVHQSQQPLPSPPPLPSPTLLAAAVAPPPPPTPWGGELLGAPGTATAAAVAAAAAAATAAAAAAAAAATAAAAAAATACSDSSSAAAGPAPAPAPAESEADVRDDVRQRVILATSDATYKIYCQGELLSVIQNAHLYPDSKKFVDMRLIYSPEETLEQFDALMNQTGGNPSKEQIQKFVNDYFEEGNELEVADIPDWVAEPKLLRRIADPKLRGWAAELNGIWKNLSRKVSDEVREHSDRHSLIYVPHHFIVPGGRFRELYYWDTYWIVRGLLLSDMKDTVKGIIENFLYLLDNYGIIPNGARIYYLERSQPPLLTPMVYNYYLATKDGEFVKKNIHLLERELDFWMKNRTVKVQQDGRTYTLIRYYSPSQGPRPESYREDYMNGQVFSTDQRKEEFYIDLKSAAESGWDFSSRWFIKDGSNKGNLTDIHTKYIIPVDVNAFVYGNARLLSTLHSEVLGDLDKAKKYSRIAHELKEAVTAILWNGTVGSWFDYDLLNGKQRTYFYPSNLAPLWTKCYNEKETPIIAQKVVKYLQGIEILQHYLGGIPTSLNNTGEQWDLPNAWPPLQNIIIQGLQSTQEPSAQKLAYEFAEQWIRSNYKGFVEHHDMYEKYDAEVPGKSGGGGEYIPQSGFGWTNGVVFELLDTYGALLTADNTKSFQKRSLMDILIPPSSES